MLFICKLFICFIIFSFLGWCLEVGYGIYSLKRFVNRGFLVGPLCPVYGTGCVIIYVLLKGYANDPIMLSLAAMVICSVLEYVTSYLMEKIFKARWWDYSNMKFNINGRICLETIIPFGLLGLLVVYILFPFTLNILDKIPALAIYIVSGVLLVILLADLIISFNVISKFSKAAQKAPKDMTEEITKFVRSTLAKQSILTKRIIDSFPNFEIEIDAIKNKILKKIKK